LIKTIPIEYYTFSWISFADHALTTARSIALKPNLIDASTLRNNGAASRFILDIVKDSLTNKERVDLALSYRQMTVGAVVALGARYAGTSFPGRAPHEHAPDHGGRDRPTPR
jgi:hypothetical protein